MKAYGNTRQDKWSCAYGCCTGKSDKKKNCRKDVDRSKRKTARQAGKVMNLPMLMKQ